MIDLRLGDCKEVLKTLPAASIDLTVTSPPYDNLRAYKGYTFDFEPIAQQLYRVTKPGGVVVWVVADATINGSETLTSFRQALYFRELGFNLHDTMIYEKCGISYPSRTRYYSSFEYMFIFSSGAPKTFNPISDHINKSYGRKVTGTDRGTDGLTKKRDSGRYVAELGVRMNVWKINHSGKDRELHPATFPESLARDHILSWSNPGDVVLDPFAGSGTTGKMALLTGRDFIGIEIAPEYFGIAQKRIETAQAQIRMAV